MSRLHDNVSLKNTKVFPLLGVFSTSTKRQKSAFMLECCRLKSRPVVGDITVPDH